MKHSMPFLACAAALSLFGAGCNPFAPEPPASPQPPSANPSEIPQPPASTSTPVTPSPSSTAQTIDFKEVAVKQDLASSTIDVTYPQMINPSDKEMEATFNEAVASSVHMALDQYREDFDQMVKDGFDSAGPWSLYMDADVVYRSSEVIDVYGEGDIYTGGAHPNRWYVSVLFDLKNKKVLSVDEILKDGSAGLKTLSRLTLVKLKVMNDLTSFSDDQWMKSGAAASSTNYQFFFFTPHGLTFVFPPYQVAAYAAGTQQVEFSSRELKGLLVDRLIPNGEATDTSNWATYHDPSNAFEFRLPADLAAMGKPVVDYSYKVETATNLKPAPSGALDCRDQEKVHFGTTDFCHSVETEGAAGSSYRTDTYTAVQSGKAAVIHFTSRYLNDPRIMGGCESGTSTEEKCRKFDPVKDTAVFGQILSTFSFIK